MARQRRTRPETVLVVDDEPSIVMLVCRALESAGYATLAADCASKALKMFRTDGPVIDLIVTDVMMPDTSGFELVRALHGMNPRVRHLFMTGQIESLPDDLVGSCGQVPKPFTPQQIVGIVRECLDLAHRQSAEMEAR